MTELNLEVVFQNEHFCAVFKPAKYLSVPSRMGEKDTRPVAGIQLQIQLGQTVWPCHRLDEDVSGLLLFALSANAHRNANAWFEQHTLQKIYQALSEEITTETGAKHLWKCRLMRGKRRAYEAAFGKESRTEAVCLGPSRKSNHHSLWQLKPLTGRSHQLRYEMSKHGAPILGDTLYGSKSTFYEDGIALRAVRLDFSQCKEASSFGLPPLLTLRSEDCFGDILV